MMILIMTIALILGPSWKVTGHMHAKSILKQDVETERNALIRLYNVTGGPSWHNSSDWLNADISHCSWYGITCSPINDTNTLVNHVIGIVLPDNHLNGTLPMDLFCSFPHLTGLFLEFNKLLSGPLPSMSCVGSSLGFFFAESCSFNGSMPDYSNNTSLRSLHLSDNHLSGELPQHWITNLTQLIDIDISGNTNLNGSFPAPMGCVSLQLVSLSGCSFNELPSFESNTKLKILSASHNSVQSFPRVPRGVTQLDLSYNSLSGSIPPYVYDLPALTFLDLGWNALTGSLYNFTWDYQLQISSLYCNFFTTTNMTNMWPKSIRSSGMVCYDANKQDYVCASFCGYTPQPTTVPTARPTPSPIPSSPSTDASTFTWSGLSVGFVTGVMVVLLVIGVVKLTERIRNRQSPNRESAYRVMQ